MSQHDYDVANQAGSLFRGDLNAVLAAIRSLNSESSEPASKEAYMWWADTNGTTGGWLKQRNATNTAWIHVMRLASAAGARMPHSAQSGASYSVVASDFGSLITVSNGCTLNLIDTTDATLGGAGFWFAARNADTSATSTIDPSGSQTIDGTATMSLSAGESCFIVSDGANWRTIGRNQFIQLIVSKNFQTQYDSAAIRSESTSGDVWLALHASGSSAASLMHARGTNNLSILNASGGYVNTFLGNLTSSGFVSAGAGGYVTGGLTVYTGNVNVNAGDLWLRRSDPNQGVVYLGQSGTRYLWFNGSNYIMPQGSLIMDSDRQVQAGSFRAEQNAYFFAGSTASISCDYGNYRIQTTYRALHPNGYDNGTMGYAMVNSDAGMGAHSIQAGYIAVSLWGAGYGYSVFASDAKHKENIKDAVYDATADVLRFKFKEFDWKPEALDKGHVPLGLVAQDVEQIDPRYVITPVSENPVKMLDDRSLLVLALKSLQEANIRIAALEEKVSNLTR